MAVTAPENNLSPAPPAGWASLLKAAEIIRQACRDKRYVTIWGHDDLDGIASTAIMMDALGGKARTGYYIPPKHGLHYGLDVRILDKLAADGTGLIITVDGGISNYTEAEYCREKGLLLIITDHHELPSRLPPAEAVVNPKITEAGAPYANLCGAGVALHLAAALEGLKGEGWHLKYPRRLAWAALATVSDRVPLLDDNRIIIKAGLESISRDPVLTRLADLLDFDLSRGLSPNILQNTYLPLFSTSQSLGNLHPMVELLTGNIDEPRVRDLWQRQVKWRLRFDQELRQKLADLGTAQAGIIVAIDDNLPGDMIGPLAGGIRDSLRLPAVVIGRKGGAWVGEARGHLPFDLVEMLSGLKEHFLQYGGHKQAAGFTLKAGSPDGLAAEITRYAAAHRDLILGSRPEAKFDYHFDGLRQLREKAPAILEKGPYGAGNPRPNCLINNIRWPGTLEPEQTLWLDELPEHQAPGLSDPAGISVTLDTTSTGKVSLSINKPQSI